MKLSTKSEYAFLALLEIAAAHQQSQKVKMNQISEIRNIPRKYLEQILLPLKQGGIIRTKRGASGGIYLAKSPGEISLAEVVRLMDGALAPTLSVSTFFYEKTPIAQSREFLNFFQEIRDYISDKLENTYLDDLMPKS